MVTSFLVRDMPRRSARALFFYRNGASLLELIIVLVIIGVMASLLFPALQSARSKANTVACRNNVRQVGWALSRFVDAKKRFPLPNQWTIDILKWIEEEPLAREFENGIPSKLDLPCPPLLRCAAQPQVNSTIPGVLVSHYVLVVDRPFSYVKGDRVRWEIQDRPLLNDDDPLKPWYVGPEITFPEQGVMFEKMRGPHPGGVFYTHYGAMRGGSSD